MQHELREVAVLRDVFIALLTAHRGRIEPLHNEFRSNTEEAILDGCTLHLKEFVGVVDDAVRILVFG